ncbi:hypothetical protein OOU_Y34scaffold00132g11 [Pyricularia oryzae Y34]|uniref:Uncharacterized protein n=2 Tax=Pyricularia oryzae TaxID=318829 RepID=A0AA97P888_PYRO3|nr:hypothetical protein OOU_Y34scaffold00132g11 [Pyricularia oryzae Y34]
MTGLLLMLGLVLKLGITTIITKKVIIFGI